MRATYGYDIFCHYFNDLEKELVVGTTKLTRKEILAEDQVHGSMVMLVEFFNTNKKIILVTAAAAIILALGIYGVFEYLDSKNLQAQEILGRGMDFYHADVDPEAADDPYANGSVASFKTDSDKYLAASKEFQSILSDYGFTKASTLAEYYLGLTQLKMGDIAAGVESLQSVSSESNKGSLGYLADKVLARVYENEGRYNDAREILEAMIQDEDYELPQEELRLQLARILKKEGKYEDALNVLQEGASQGSSLSPLRQRLTDELEETQRLVQLQP